MGSSNSGEKSSPLIFGYSPFAVWRVAFYALMAYNWKITYHGPCGGPWMDSLSYDHAEWVYDVAPKTHEAVERLRWFGFAIGLLSTFNNGATIIFAALTGQHIFHSLIMFINHDYLFFLLSTIMAIYCNCGNDNIHGKAGWIHALRGQIVIVYAFASLWKLDSDWLNGDIVKGIFLSFEEQGANRGVPWSKIYAAYPSVFVFLGLSGILLDSMLFLVLMFLPPGHKLQSVGFLFHGFTGYTMSQRIGYSFPLAMILASLVFQQSDVIDKDQVTVGGDTLSHAKWLMVQVWPRPNRSNSKGNESVVKKRHILPIFWLLSQWLIPLRMPIVSRFEFKHTFEGYRWSWTMMLHGKGNLHGPGLFFMTLRPECGEQPYPNPFASQHPFGDIHSFPYEDQLVNVPRSRTVIQMFPRQMPKVAHQANKILGDACVGDKKMVMKTSYFSTTNDGPYHRIVDPTSDLIEAHRVHTNLPWLSKFWYALIDKAPPGHEFVLRGTGSINIPLGAKDEKGDITFVDRSSCLQADPIRIHSNHFNIRFDSNSEIDFRLLLRGCPELNLQNCKEIYLDKGETLHLPALRTVTIGIDKRIDLGTSCSESTKEDVVIKLTQVEHIGMQNQQQ